MIYDEKSQTECEERKDKEMEGWQKKEGDRREEKAPLTESGLWGVTDNGEDGGKE